MDHLFATQQTTHAKLKYGHTLNLLEEYVNSNTKMLDVAERNPLTVLMEKKFNIKIDSTTGDLDESFDMPEHDYDLILASHVIEHIFNPLHMLLVLKKALAPDGRMIIILPQRMKFLWTKHHFHEIDDYRMKILFKRAGLKVEKAVKRKVKRGWGTYFRGIRAFLRLFFEYSTTYVVSINK